MTREGAIDSGQKSYIMYHCHSFYSLLDSCTDYKDYIELAVKSGAKAVSISEHGKPLNWGEKYGACKAAGVRYIHSMEIYLTESLEEKVRDNYHTILMAKNIDGLKELNELVSRSCDKDHFYYTNRISFDEFLSISDNIISTSACLASPLNKLDECHPRYAELVQKYDFLEVQAHNHPEQVEFNRRLLDLSKRYNKRLIAGTDTHSSSKYKAECRSILLSAKHKTYGDEDAFDLSYKTYDELVDMFRQQGSLPEDIYMQAIENTNLLYDMTEDIELDTSIKYPILYGSRENDEKVFEETVTRKFKDKLDSGVIPVEQEQAFRDAIKEEMRVFKKLNMTGFMLSMSELVCWCKERGFAVGTARGSVGGSRIAYITDIIDLNPETWHTVFSRFANEDREEIGDIDIDCIESNRPAIFKHITEKFGQNKTARVASFGTLVGRSVIDEIGRALMYRWNGSHGYADKFNSRENPYRYDVIEKIKSDFESDPDSARKKYPEVLYYFDGLEGTKVSQSVHPAGMVISPISLRDNFGCFDKDGESCLMLDMENIHDYTGLAKYDFLVLKTVQVIRDTCAYMGMEYPKSHEINWDDQDVWNDMIKSPSGLFQFEGKFAYDSLKKFRPQSIFDMSLVTAAIRPSGASYRDELLARIQHSNPSEIIDDMLKDNLGFVVYQEDTLKFLQQICGLSGSDADNVRRAIGRKQKDRLDKAMPSILEGYCAKSDKPREIAEQEAKEFLQVIEDSASYQFGYNHSIAYCMLGYYCAYYRYYHPLEFVTSFLNNAKNEDDIKNGSSYAESVGIKITMPKWGISKGEYSYDAKKRTIARGMSSIKYIGESVACELFDLSKQKDYTNFVDVLFDIDEKTSVNTRQLDILIKIDFFSEFGNQRELLRITDVFYNRFKKGQAKKISRDIVDGTELEHIVKKYSVGVTKSGGVAKSYTLLDTKSLIKEIWDEIRSACLPDLSVKLKVQNFADVMGYAGYTTGEEKDRPLLYITAIYPVVRKKDNKQFGYSITTRSIGSGKDGRFTVFNKEYNNEPFVVGDIIRCTSFTRNGKYFSLTGYNKIF